MFYFKVDFTMIWLLYTALPPTRAPSEGELMGGGFFWYYIFLRQSSFYIALHSPQTKRLRKEVKNILIHNNTLQSFVWSSIALKIHVSHFENWIYLFVVSLQKWLAHFLLQKRWKSEAFKGTSRHATL